MKEPPTRDFERWNGKPYVSKNRDVRKRIIQPPRRDDKNQNPVPDARTDRPGMPDMRRPGARDGHPADCPGEWDIQGIGSSRRTVHN